MKIAVTVGMTRELTVIISLSMSHHWGKALPTPPRGGMSVTVSHKSERERGGGRWIDRREARIRTTDIKPATA